MQDIEDKNLELLAEYAAGAELAKVFENGSSKEIGEMIAWLLGAKLK